MIAAEGGGGQDPLPLCLDLSRSDGVDAPVVEGTFDYGWTFADSDSSVLCFMRRLARRRLRSPE
ncbi:MAG: hypothetical protein R3F62_21300 [Planctomycetota bacterium]